jgi:uncharacterized damage-inducible protein DinB
MIEAVKTLSGLYGANSELLVRSVQGLSPEQVTAWHGEEGNSILWIVGHVVTSRYGVCNYLGLDVTNPFGRQFTRGAKRKDDVADYPPFEDLLEDWKKVSGTVQDGFGVISQERWKEGITASFPGVESTVEGAVSFLHLHESYHIGQLAYIRRILGSDQVVG